MTTNKVNRAFFKAVQNEITLTDFRRFRTNKDIIDQNTKEIRERLASVSLSLEARNEANPKSLGIYGSNKSSVRGKELTSDRTPLSLRLYEAEISRVEKQLLSNGIIDRLPNLKDRVGSTDQTDLKTLFSTEEREKIGAGASDIAKERLEPKELDINRRSVRPEAGSQAIVTFKQLEESHYLYQYSHDKAKIAESFARLDKEAAKLHEIRAAYTKAEKLVLLKDGVKLDLVDLLRRNPDTNGLNLIDQATNILRQNIAKAEPFKLIRNDGLITVLSREIGEKIESRRQLLVPGESKANNQIDTHNSVPAERASSRNVSLVSNIREKSVGDNIYSR